MSSYIFEGKLMHSRRDNVHHQFVYSVFMLLIDLDDVPHLERDIPGFGYNKRKMVTLHDKDHLPHPNQNPNADGLKGMVLARFAEAGINLGEGGKVYILTNPRIFGYVFNPLTVYYGCDASGCLVAILAEVNNTLGDQHPYLLSEHNMIPQQKAEERQYDMRRYVADKVFYVSPWISMDARYEMSLTPVGSKIIVHIDEFREGTLFFQARLWGNTQPLTRASLRRMLWRYPWMTLKVIGAIHWEGIKIHLKGARFTRKKNAYTNLKAPKQG